MECHDVSSHPDGVNGHIIFKKAKIGAFLYSQSGNAAIKKSITKEMANSLQLLGQKKNVFGDDFLALHGRFCG